MKSFAINKSIHVISIHWNNKVITNNENLFYIKKNVKKANENILKKMILRKMESKKKEKKKFEFRFVY